MKKIYSKKTKKNKKDKYKLIQYWSILYPKEYVDALTSKTVDERLTKIASDKLEETLMKGKLRQDDEGYVFIDIDDKVIHGMYPLIDDEDVEKPPYFGKDGWGAHVSVISPDEIDEDEPLDIKEIGDIINFKIKEVYSTNPEGWDEMDKVWFISIDAPELGKLRRKYKLPTTYKNKGHDFHITVAVRRKK
jgi:hypothetical protein